MNRFEMGNLEACIWIVDTMPCQGRVDNWRNLCRLVVLNRVCYLLLVPTWRPS